MSPPPHVARQVRLRSARGMPPSPSSPDKELRNLRNIVKNTVSENFRLQGAVDTLTKLVEVLLNHDREHRLNIQLLSGQVTELQEILFTTAEDRH